MSNLVPVTIDEIVAENYCAYQVSIEGKYHWIPKNVAQIANYKSKINVEWWFVQRVMMLNNPNKSFVYSTQRLLEIHATKHVSELLPVGSYPHQVAAFKQFRNLRVFALFMECRSGKTKVAIDIMTNHILSGEIEKVIWFCPVSVIETAKWQWGRFSEHSEKVVFFGTETASSCKKQRFDELIKLAKSCRCGLVVDESHMIKNERAKRSGRIEQLANFCHVKGVLSGTPITRNIEDIFNQIFILDWKILGYRNKYQFQKNHLIMDDRIPGLVRGTYNLEYISERLKPFVYEHFPENSENNDEWKYIYSQVSEEQRKLYNDIKKTIISKMENYTNDTFDIYLLFTALQSVLAGYVSATIMNRIFGVNESVTLNSAKLTDFINFRAAIDDKAIVWCARRHEIDLIKRTLPEMYVVDGSTPPPERHKIIRQFRESTCGTLAAMMPVAKRGIDIFECDHAFFFGQSFDYESREQAAARIKLPNKERTCYFYNLLYRNSLDERIQESHYRKSNIVREFIRKLKENRDNAIQEIKTL
jgi:superfamily II DNA or RNA helicase